MKATSLEANKKADQTGMKQKHKQKIIAALTLRDMTKNDIAIATNLTDVQVSRRMSELEAYSKVAAVGEVNGMTLYHLTGYQTMIPTKKMSKKDVQIAVLKNKIANLEKGLKELRSQLIDYGHSEKSVLINSIDFILK